MSIARSIAGLGAPPVGGGVDYAFNFRSTLGFVADQGPESFVASSDTYPTVFANGATAGWVNGTPSVADRNAGIDRRLAGIHFRGADQRIYFRVDLEAGKTYDCLFAFGDASSQQTINASVTDGSTDAGIAYQLRVNLTQFAGTWYSPFSSTDFEYRTEAEWVQDADVDDVRTRVGPLVNPFIAFRLYSIDAEAEPWNMPIAHARVTEV